MKTKTIILALALGVSSCLLTAQDSNQRPEGQRPPGRDGGPGGFHVLPPRAREQLGLTDEQQKQVAELEADVKVKLEKILTSEQLQQLKQMRPPGRPGGPGGPNASGPGSSPNDQSAPQRPALDK